VHGVPGFDTHGPEGFDLPAFLPYRLNRLAARVSKALASVYQERFDLTVPQWRVLATLAGGAGSSAGDGGAAAPTARDLAALTGLDKVSVSRALSGLVERRLVMRLPHRSDARSLTLHLTRRGERLFERIAPLALAWESAWLEPLAPGERAQLLALLARLEGAVPADSSLAAIAGLES
jgi:DNA-binding MarR family transcriptional regulator